VQFGYGFLGRWHLEKLMLLSQELGNLEVLGVVDPAEASGLALKVKYPNLSYYKKWQDIPSDFDAALIVTPTAYHFALCEELMQKGCHIFCEKPITQTEEEAQKLLAISRSRPKQVFQSGHSERMHAIWDQVKKDVELTTAPFLQFKRVSPFKNRATDVDVISDLMIHDIDLLCFLTKEIPLEVSAIGLRQQTSHFDYVRANFKLLSGQEVTIESSRISSKVERSVELFGKKKSVLIDLASLEYTETRGEDVIKYSYDKRDHLYLEQKAFFHSINNELKPIVNAEEGYLAVKIAHAVRKSALHQMRVFIQ
jgi:predicted dehydrogenase